MSYDHLIGLYFSETANADLADKEVRAALHVGTALEALVELEVCARRDVVLTGNPGDGKSHLIRILEDRGALHDAILEPDLSAKATNDVLENWSQAATKRVPFVLCANEGPLKDLISAMAGEPTLSLRQLDLHRQLGRLLVARKDELPEAPQSVTLVDLADRVVLDSATVDAALDRLATDYFLPQVGMYDVAETSAGRNLLYLRQFPELRRRVADGLVSAGRRCGEHVTFRQLWAAIAYAITRAKPVERLEAEFREDVGILGTLPFDNLADGDGRGLLLEAARQFADPAFVTDPDLDDQIWSYGQPASGRWIIEEFPAPPAPARLWGAGQYDEAISLHCTIKRAVAFAHDRGASLVDRLGEWRELPSAGDHDTELLAEVLDGLRALYVAPSEGLGAPTWLCHGLPLWTGLTYRDVPIEERPQVATRAATPSEFQILRPIRAPWLGDALGPPPEEIWLSHRASNIALRVDPALMFVLNQARRSSGPLCTPETVHRFLSRLVGWDELHLGLDAGRETFAVLRHARGPLVAVGTVSTWEGGLRSYGIP